MQYYVVLHNQHATVQNYAALYCTARHRATQILSLACYVIELFKPTLLYTQHPIYIVLHQIGYGTTLYTLNTTL